METRTSIADLSKGSKRRSKRTIETQLKHDEQPIDETKVVYEREKLSHYTQLHSFVIARVKQKLFPEEINDTLQNEPEWYGVAQDMWNLACVFGHGTVILFLYNELKKLFRNIPSSTTTLKELKRNLKEQNRSQDLPKMEAIIKSLNIENTAWFSNPIGYLANCRVDWSDELIKDEATPLMSMLKHGNAVLATFLIKRCDANVDVNHMVYALRKKRRDIVECLIQSGVSFRDALRKAKIPDKEIIEMFLLAPSQNQTVWQKILEVIATYSIVEDSVDLWIAVSKAGFKITPECSSRLSPGRPKLFKFIMMANETITRLGLGMAILESKHVKVDGYLKLSPPESLLQLLNQPDPNSGDTPLLIACDKMDTYVIPQLLSYGADVNLCNSLNGESPLVRALSFIVKNPHTLSLPSATNPIGMISTLLAKGADASYRDNEAINMIFKSGNPLVVQSMERVFNRPTREKLTRREEWRAVKEMHMQNLKRTNERDNNQQSDDGKVSKGPATKKIKTETGFAQQPHILFQPIQQGLPPLPPLIPGPSLLPVKEEPKIKREPGRS